jgi:serine protease AprX
MLMNNGSRVKFLVATLLVAASAFTLRGSAQDHNALLSADLLAHQARGTSSRVRVIVHGSPETISALAGRHHLQIVRRLNDGAVLAADSHDLANLASDFNVDHLSGDLPVRTAMSISAQAPGADQVWAGSSAGLLGLGNVSGVNGQGVVVAVVDSGIDTTHPALAKKVLAAVSFVSDDPSTGDAYGHGTHVAGIIAGVGAPASRVTPLYGGGIAPGAQLVNVRVLGEDGSGLTSDVIAGIDWVVENRATYNIRAMNLSLGHPVVEPSATDPLCEAVARAVNAGIVVVASAGNAGVAADGTPILGGVMSPGNSPLAITVGATNTQGTARRSDDTVATYSSRGPTRYDFAVKPDLAAPGTKIVSLESTGSYLASHYSSLHKAGVGANSYMQLSGTGMSAPMVSGATALLLQGVPNLSPAQVKLALQAGATYMNDGGLMGAGAGNANFWASRKIAENGLGLVLNTTVGGVVSNASGVVFWDAGSLAYRMYGGLGMRLLSLLELPTVWPNPSLLQAGDLNLLGLLNPLAQVPASRLLWGEVADWTTDQQILWGTTIYNPQGQQILWGTSVDGNQILRRTSTDSTMTARDPR